MKPIGIAGAIWICGLALMSGACAAVPADSESGTVLPATVLATGQQCLPATASWAATWIESELTLQRFLARCARHQLGSPPAAPADIDFNRFRVLGLEMGQQPSAGYGFDSSRVTAMIKDGIATVGITCRRPPPGAMTAQVLTSPWVLIRLPAAPYHTIQVEDQDRRRVVELVLPTP